MHKTSQMLSAVGCCVGLLSGSAVAGEARNEPFEQIDGEAAATVTRLFALTIDLFSLAGRVRPAMGAGILIGGDRHIVTNAHLVYGASTIIVRLSAEDVRDG